MSCSVKEIKYCADVGTSDFANPYCSNGPTKNSSDGETICVNVEDVNYLARLFFPATWSRALSNWVTSYKNGMEKALDIESKNETNPLNGLVTSRAELSLYNRIYRCEISFFSSIFGCGLPGDSEYPTCQGFAGYVYSYPYLETIAECRAEE